MVVVVVAAVTAERRGGKGRKNTAIRLGKREGSDPLFRSKNSVEIFSNVD